MVIRIADNIISPLGETTAQNYEAVKSGRTMLRRYDHYDVIPEPFTASFLTEEQWQRLAVQGLTRFESLAYHSALRAIREAAIDVAQPGVVFILSTTKGNIEQLSAHSSPSQPVDPGTAARRVAEALGIASVPIAVSNACISGVSAIILAMRLLESRSYDYAVVTGADILTPFVVSGFLSLKAISAEPCRPFDIERLGLNLGEAAATIVLRRGESIPDGVSPWCFPAGAVSNDGFHIVSPSKSGDGARRALEAVGAPALLQQLAFINAHGTATMFNDQMESVAIERAGLSTLPVNALKGWFGHTLGAAGILETILSMTAVDDHTILGTKGYCERGVSGRIQLSAHHSPTTRQSFVKMISGFGGCNGALVATRTRALHSSVAPIRAAVTKIQATITPTSATVDGQPVTCEGEGMALLTDLYRRYVGDYPRYYKMDALCRLGFVASELLLQAEHDRRELPRSDRAIVLFNHTSSIQSDLSYLSTISAPTNYFPSPSVFVYTLPNIVTGEIAIRNNYQGETTLYVLPQYDRRHTDQVVERVLLATALQPTTASALTGWIDYADDRHFMAEFRIVDFI